MDSVLVVNASAKMATDWIRKANSVFRTAGSSAVVLVEETAQLQTPVNASLATGLLPKGPALLPATIAKTASA